MQLIIILIVIISILVALLTSNNAGELLIIGLKIIGWVLVAILSLVLAFFIYNVINITIRRIYLINKLKLDISRAKKSGSSSVLMEEILDEIKHNDALVLDSEKIKRKLLGYES